MRMKENHFTRRSFVLKSEGIGRRGRPRLRWEDGMKDDSKILSERNWKRLALNR